MSQRWLPMPDDRILTAMAHDDDPFGLQPRPKPPAHEIGQPLDALSVDEFDERIAILKDEIARLERARAAKAAANLAADAFFRRAPGGD